MPTMHTFVTPLRLLLLWLCQSQFYAYTLAILSASFMNASTNFIALVLIVTTNVSTLAYRNQTNSAAESWSVPAQISIVRRDCYRILLDRLEVPRWFLTEKTE